jgi:WhiB family redox-sensing transcriptional regulator
MTMLTLSRDWWRLAACRDAEPELFFPISARPVLHSAIKHAKLICARCPVQSECLDYALANRQEQGIWGGLTDEERRLLRRRLSRSGRTTLTREAAQTAVQA